MCFAVVERVQLLFLVGKMKIKHVVYICEPHVCHLQEHERLHQQLLTAHQSKETERSRLRASLTEGLF